MIKSIVSNYRRWWLGQCPELGHGGERQVAKYLRGIQADHRNRYKYAISRLEPGVAILDLACGVGYGSKMMADALRPSRIVGADLSDSAIAFAKTYYRADNLEYFCKDARQLKFEESFDAIVTFETIEHIAEEDEFVQMLKCLLKKTGRIFASTPNQEKYPFTREYNPYHVRHHTPAGFNDLFERNGLKVVARKSQLNGAQSDVVEGTQGRFLVYEVMHNGQ